jgi:hypothetical protein
LTAAKRKTNTIPAVKTLLMSFSFLARLSRCFARTLSSKSAGTASRYDH